MHIKIIAIILSVILFLSGCNTNKTDNNSQPDDFVTIKWILKGKKPTDYDKVLNEINIYIKEKINANLEITWIPDTAYYESLADIISSNIEYDIAWTGNESDFFVNNMIDGNFASINQFIIDKNQSLFDFIPEDIFKGVSYKDEIYGIPNYNLIANRFNVVFDKNYIDKYDIGYSTVDSLEGLNIVLSSIKSADPEKVVLAMDKNGYIGLFDEYDLIINSPPIGIKLDIKDNITAVNPYENDETLSNLHILNSWYSQEIINKTAPHVELPSEYLYKEGAVFGFYGYPDFDLDLAKVYEKEYSYVEIGDLYTKNSNIRESLNIISSSSKNKEKSFDFLNLVNSDSKLRNLLAYGIEGEHYKKIGGTNIEIINDRYIVDKLIQGTFFNLYTEKPMQTSTLNKYKDFNKSSKESPILGFVYDDKNLKSKIDTCSIIYEKWMGKINTGSLPPIESTTKMIEELNSAGYRDIIQDIQTQLDKYYK